MGYDWMSELKKEAQRRTSEVVAEATQRAMGRVQRDFHTQVIEKIASETGHENLSQACYCMLSSSGSDIGYDIFYDASFIEGFYSSNSLFHQGGSKWRSVRSNYNLSRYDFWEKYEDSDVPRGNYGIVDEQWIMKNFWNGVQYGTNGWPLARSAEYLQVYRTATVAAYDVAKNFVDDYISEGHYEKYIQQEINNLI